MFDEKKKTIELENQLEQEILLLEQNVTVGTKDELSNIQKELELTREKKQIARLMYWIKSKVDRGRWKTIEICHLTWIENVFEQNYTKSWKRRWHHCF